MAEAVTIKAPNFKVGEFRVRGVTPLVMNKFSEKARAEMREKQEAGSTANKSKKREGKDFYQAYLEAIHYDQDGNMGLPAPGIRAALVSACRMCGFYMSRAKLSVFVEADGFDSTDGTPLVHITKGEPEYHETYVRNESGVADIRPRPMWQPGWEAVVRVRFDADQFTLTDVANLLVRAGMQVGIGEGRPDSRKSAGQGWGMFDVMAQEEGSRDAA